MLEHEPRIITTEGEDQLPAGGSAWRRRSADGVDWWLRVDDGGVYRVATKSDLDDEPRADAQRRYVLKAPIAVGTAWQATTTAYLLRRRQEFPPEIRHSHPAVVMTYTIEALDDKVSVQAGAFERCVRVGGSAVLKLFADPVVGWRELPLTTTEWYCHGPGLVKVVRKEPANSTFLVGGTLTMELISMAMIPSHGRRCWRLAGAARLLPLAGTAAARALAQVPERFPAAAHHACGCPGRPVAPPT